MPACLPTVKEGPAWSLKRSCSEDVMPFMSCMYADRGDCDPQRTADIPLYGAATSLLKHFFWVAPAALAEILLQLPASDG